MAESPTNFHRVRDRETLLRLASGVEIIRAMKHEPISLDSLSSDERLRLTNKLNGSKFAAGWTLERYVRWLSEFSDQQGWQFPPSINHRIRIRLNDAIGIAGGKISHTIEVCATGRYIHAYPVED